MVEPAEMPPPVARDSVAQLSEVPALTRLVLRGEVAGAGGCEAVLGLAVPTRVNSASVAGTRAVLCLGPDEWLVLDRPEAALDLGARLAGAAAGRPFAWVDVSHRSVALILEGPEVEAVLAAGCPLRLDNASFPVGRATRTLFAKAEVLLWRQAADRFHIDVARSFAPYVRGLLATAMASEAAIAAAGIGSG